MKRDPTRQQQRSTILLPSVRRAWTTPSDFHFFHTLRRTLEERRFTTNEAVRTFVRTQDIDFSHARYMSHPSHAPKRDHSIYIWPGLQVSKLLFVQFSPISYHFITLRSTYSPEQPVFGHPQFIFLPSRQRTSFTLVQNYRKSKSFEYFKLYAFRQQRNELALHRFLTLYFTRYHSQIS
jgi:hypothetical protein